jgi:hypothetical protein
MAQNRTNVAAVEAAGAGGPGPANQQGPDICAAVRQVLDGSFASEEVVWLWGGDLSVKRMYSRRGGLEWGHE